jgi:hypothetical protein
MRGAKSPSSQPINLAESGQQNDEDDDQQKRSESNSNTHDASVLSRSSNIRYSTIAL